MSTPSEEVQQRAAEARQSAYHEAANPAVEALLDARASLFNAADAADELDKILRDVENDVDRLRAYAHRVRDRRNEPSNVRQGTLERAEGLQDRLRRAQQSLGDVNDRLRKSATAIAASQEFVTELEQKHGYGSATTEQLRQRLTGLDRAVHGSIAGVERTGWRLEATHRNLRPVLDIYGSDQTREQTAATIESVTPELTRDVAYARGGLEVMGKDFHKDSQDAFDIGGSADELRRAIRAGLNPTRADEEAAPGSAQEDPRRLWAEGRLPGQGLDR